VAETNHHDASALNAIAEVALKYFRLRGRDAALLGPAPDIDQSISGEIFSVERLEQYAAILARTQDVARTNSGAISLHARLRDNSAVLSSVYQTLLRRMRGAKAVTPAAEWLVDNYYICLLYTSSCV